MEVAFLFDNDGVLIDSSALHWESWQRLMDEENSNFKMNHDSFKRGFGKRNDLILQDAAPDATAEVRQKWAERKEELFRTGAKGRITLLPGMESFLQQTVAAKIPHIIASSTPSANLEMYLATTEMGKYFDDYVSAETVAHGKPFPDVFLAAAKRLNFPPQKCIVFEDAPAGLTAGKAAGCFLVALETTHGKEELTLANLCYPSAKELDLQEILDAFSQWQGD